MTNDIKERLSRDLGSANWIDLAPHLKRNQLIVVSNELDITDVGMQIAEDNAEVISAWMEQGKISKPKEDQLKRWGADNPKFLCAIVQPFVLIKEEV